MIYSTDRLRPEERVVSQQVLASATYADGTARSTRHPRRMPARSQPNKYRAVIARPAPGCDTGTTRRRWIGDAALGAAEARLAAALAALESTG